MDADLCRYGWVSPEPKFVCTNRPASILFMRAHRVGFVRIDLGGFMLAHRVGFVRIDLGGLWVR